MAPPLNQIHLRTGTMALSFLKRPSGFLAAWDLKPTGAVAQYARYCGPEPGTAQTGVAPVYAVVPNGASYDCAAAQFLSDPLRKQDIPAQTWRIGFAAKLANAGVNYTWRGRAALYVVNGRTGGIRATIFNLDNVGSGARTATTERTCFAAAMSGAAASVFAGDYLVLELGLRVSNAAGALAPQITVYSDGSAPISSDNVATTNAQSVLYSVAELALSLPTAGEQPQPSLTWQQAVRAFKDHYAERTDRIYKWDGNGPLAHLFDFLGEALKVYGYDQLDRARREFNPLTTVELLPAWEAILGISQTRSAQRGKTVEQRRKTVLARLREIGPLTPYNLAGIFAQLAEYAAGAAPSVYELDRVDQDTHSTAWSDTYTGGVSIPSDTAFQASNLVVQSPVLLDGGLVSDAGVCVTLSLNNSSTEGLRFRLWGPDFTYADWGGADFPLPSGLSTTLKLRSTAHVGRAIHGSWQLYCYRVVGAPLVKLNGWSLYTLGKGHGGWGQGKFNWSVYLDDQHHSVDQRDIDSTLARVSQSYARGFCVYSARAVPGEIAASGLHVHRPGRFLPGA